MPHDPLERLREVSSADLRTQRGDEEPGREGIGRCPEHTVRTQLEMTPPSLLQVAPREPAVLVTECLAQVGAVVGHHVEHDEAPPRP